MNQLIERPWDICECGDYRDQHANGSGRCIFGRDHIPRVECRRFVFSYSRPDDERDWRQGACSDNRPATSRPPSEVRKDPAFPWPESV